MDDAYRWSEATRPVEEVARHDQLCDDYEDDLRAGTAPPLEEVLARVPESERAALFVALVRVIWDCVLPPPMPEELAAQYPRFAGLLPHAAAGRGPRGPVLAVPGYRIEQKLGQGGMGVVYLARRLDDDCAVAVKVMRAGQTASDAEVYRFERESRVARRFDHPRVVQVLEAGSQGGLAYCVMEFVPGGTLADRIGGQPVDPGWAADLLAAVADGVDYIHSLGVVHRDLKPSNVLLDTDDQPLVADFGLARPLGETPITHSRAVLGTASYMAPEQAQGSRVGPAVDVYALGAILFELLTGRPPFREPTFELTLAQVIRDDPPWPSELVSAVPAELEAICLKCLEKDPARRYPSAAAVADDLRRWRAGEAVSVVPLSDFDLTARWAHRVGYDLARELGRDRWTYSYSAVQRSTGHRVVVVACNSRCGEPARNALRRQAHALAGLRHAHLVRLLDSIDSSPQPFLVLEHADGTPLQRPLPPPKATEVVSGVAAGLQAVHDRGLVHLGVCVTAIGVNEDAIARLGGFGLARPLGSPMGDLTDEITADVLPYTAPEVLDGRWEEVSPATDIYSLGAVLYDYLSARPPFHTPSPKATREWVLSDRPPAPLPATAPATLADVCLACLAKRPADRPGRMLDVIARLGQLSSADDTATSLDVRDPSSVQSFRLRVVGGPIDVGREVRFEKRRVRVGRSKSCDFFLDYDTVSKEHFAVHRSEGTNGFVLTDLGSKNGVRVNGDSVEMSRTLSHGDLISVVDFRIVFEVD